MSAAFRGWLTASLVLVAGCRQGAPPEYVRLRGPAPELADVPASRALLVTFWASWCQPCLEETPALLALAEDPPEGMAVVVFSQDDSLAPVQKALGGLPPALNVRLDVSQATARALGVDALPAAVLVVDGRQVARFSGVRSWDGAAMRALLRRLMDEGADGSAR